MSERIKTVARVRRLMTGVLLTSCAWSAAAIAQEAQPSPAGSDSSGQLEEIIVTAQKREQNLQDVPIAVTALSESALAANRVTTVSDLSGLAPGVAVRTAAGGSQLPSFAIRGAISYGVVPGSDKQVSIYIDGVYLATARGAIFDLPDVQRIEMLRGPQGTLFGRNATAGAVSISTRDPAGKVGVKTTFTVGNYDHYRMRVSVDTPQIGPFSAYLTFVHNYATAPRRRFGIAAQPDWALRAPPIIWAPGTPTPISPPSNSSRATASPPSINMTATGKRGLQRAQASSAIIRRLLASAG